MKTNWYINNYSFRLVSAILVGIIAYFLILLFFDSVSDLNDNFFSREVLFVIVLTFIVFELTRLAILFLDRKLSIMANFTLRIYVQLLVTVVSSILVVSLLLYLYFVLFVGFTTITTELITFNGIFLIVVLLYNLYFFSIVYMKKRDEAVVKSEVSKRASIELEMRSFSNYVNPDFLFSSLEIALAELYKKEERVEEIIANLADIYRFTLDNQQTDLVLLNDDIENFRKTVSIFKIKYGKALKTAFLNNTYSTYHIIPGTVQTLFEYAVFSNIITNEIPLEFDITIVSNSLIVSWNSNEHLNITSEPNSKLDALDKAYRYYNRNGIRIDKSEGFVNIMVPLISVEEE